MMASNWLRLDTKGMFAGWTSVLPGEQYAAWVKLLQATKALGGRNGTIQKSYFTDEFLATHKMSRNAFDCMVKQAKVGNGDEPAVTETLLDYIINSWHDYQLDPTAKARKQKQRDSAVTDVTGVTVTGECHEDGTLRDNTIRDGTGQTTGFDRFWNSWPDHSRKTSKGKCRVVWKKDKLDRMADHVIAVVEALKGSKNWTDKGAQYIPAPLVWLNDRRWDCDLTKTKAAIAREGGHRPRATGLTVKDREIKETLAHGGVLTPEMQAYWDKKQNKEPKR